MIPREVRTVFEGTGFWNAGIVPVEDRYLMIGNTGRRTYKAWGFLNQALDPMGPLKEFGLPDGFDFRLFTVDQHSQYMAYHTKEAEFRAAVALNNIGVTKDWDLRRSKLTYKLETIKDWPGYKKTTPEKNWMPFCLGREIYFVYSVCPHRVLRFDLRTGWSHLAYETPWEPNWALRAHGLWGNANVVPCGDYLFAMFHSKPPRQYWTGYYLFERKPPFRPVRICKEPLFAPGMSTAVERSPRVARSFDNVIFPVGAAQVSCRQEILVSYGENDCLQRVAVFKEADLIEGSEAIA